MYRSQLGDDHRVGGVRATAVVAIDDGVYAGIWCPVFAFSNRNESAIAMESMDSARFTNWWRNVDFVRSVVVDGAHDEYHVMDESFVFFDASVVASNTDY